MIPLPFKRFSLFKIKKTSPDPVNRSNTKCASLQIYEYFEGDYTIDCINCHDMNKLFSDRELFIVQNINILKLQLMGSR